MAKEKTLSLPFAAGSLLPEAGCDEAGRGCLAGPVYAAAVILPEGFSHPWLNDSKQMSERHRDAMREIIEREALAWCVVAVDNHEIDTLNILRASITGMHRAIDGLSLRPAAIAVDGNHFTPYHDIPHTTYVKGDGRFANIAAASVLAKTHRDEYMRKIHRLHPEYGWDVNKGYPTKAHRAAIEKYGPTPFHRMSFRLIDRQLTLF